MSSSAPTRRIRTTIVGALCVGLLVLPAGPARAGLVGDLLGTATEPLDTVGGLLGVVTAGWDTGAETPPARMSLVADAIGADELWNSGIDGRGIDVAMIDTGVVPVTGLQSGNIANGPDLSFDGQVAEVRYLDAFGHGTHMAGIIAGNDGVAGGFRGIAPGARLVNVRVGAADGGVDVSQVIAAIDWVVQNRNLDGFNIRVINLSYGTDGTQSPSVDPLSFAVENAWRHGIVVVVGAGNSGNEDRRLANPATNPYVLSVGAVDLHDTASALDDTVAPFSSRTDSGRTVDLVAPGVSIASLRDPGSAIDVQYPGAVVDERYFRGSGTSQAAAVTSGAVALLLDARPELTPDQVKALLQSSATGLLSGGSSRATGAGRLDVANAARATLWQSATQTWAAASGLGSLEKARGTSHVADDGIELVGEKDIFGKKWDPATWTRLSASATAWATDGTWNRSGWSGTCWCDTSWTGRSWTGRSWTGTSWTGRSWTGRSWTGRSWTGRSWTGGSWTGRSWTGRSWTGEAWMSAGGAR